MNMTLRWGRVSHLWGYCRVLRVTTAKTTQFRRMRGFLRSLCRRSETCHLSSERIFGMHTPTYRAKPWLILEEVPNAGRYTDHDTHRAQFRCRIG